VHAATGTIEGEDLRRKRVEEEFAAASRRVAASIWRDGILGAIAVAALSAATALVT
jgi:hypothetical protein